MEDYSPQGKAEEVEPNRAFDDAAVDVPPNRDPFPNAEAEEGVNENPEEVGRMEKLQNIIGIGTVGQIVTV